MQMERCGVTPTLRSVGVILLCCWLGMGLLQVAAVADEQGGEAGTSEWDRQINRYPLQEGVDLVGEERRVTARREETLLDIAMRYGIGYEEIRRANPGVNTWLPGEGTQVRIPTRFILPDAPRRGVVVNLPEMRLYHYLPEEGVVETFPVSVGRMDWSTPLGETQVSGRIENPAWYPPRSIREKAEARGETLPLEVPPGPDNPLGAHAILLDISGYLLHSTNRPWGIGMRATHGCIRLHPHDIDRLFDQVDRGTPVRIVNQPFKAGWSEAGKLYLQALPLFEEERQKARRERIDMAVSAVVSALGDRRHRVSGRHVRAAADEQDGSLVRISRDDDV